jgi:hypothetical protein
MLTFEKGEEYNKSPEGRGFSQVKVKVKVILRLTISQSVCLGIEHPPGANVGLHYIGVYRTA